MRQCVTVLLLLLIAVAVFPQAPVPKRENRPTISAEGADELQALSNDVARMQSLVRQMEMNLALVQTSQTPLKHQFELEIEAWREVLGGMQRRLQRLRGNSRGGVVAPDTVPLRLDSRQGRP